MSKAFFNFVAGLFGHQTAKRRPVNSIYVTECYAKHEQDAQLSQRDRATAAYGSVMAKI